MIKVIIVILLIGVIFSLTSAAVFFFKDQGETKRTLYMLGLRVTLAVLLMLTISYGLYSGQLVISAPWHNPQPGLESVPAQ